MKICPRCLTEKSIEDFYGKRTKVKGGKKYTESWCRECTKRRTAALYQRVKEKRKREAVEYKGGKCIKCGYNKYIHVLEFHHRDPATKDRSIKQLGRDKLTDRLRKELDKCDLLCANCHREILRGSKYAAEGK